MRTARNGAMAKRDRDMGKINTTSVAASELPPLPESASSTPEPKKGKMETSLEVLQENIVKLVSAKITESAESIKETINELKEQSKALAKDIQEMKETVNAVEQATTNHEKRISTVETKINEMERYHRRWNLRLYGLAEAEGEDVKKKVVRICRSVLPDVGDSINPHIDICHRVGRKEEGKTRPVIIRFTTRFTRDAVWRNAKSSEALESERLRFGEDLTFLDKETRSQLWPHIETARKQGKRAFFVGAKAIIDGKEFRLQT
ncbi:hypothetical protein WMY93_014133 [Mugilogobius chulae]|uniref:L1 transposable element RRM domain-containing protein n=1 Tax=Mugilogobius chulae TaxID=88201 RepID=A0AAW0NUQ5_9GOBI